MSRLDGYEHVEVRSRAEWRAWLERNHGQAEGIWLVTHKRSEDEAHLPYAAVVEEALCWGWIDSLPRKLDERRTMLLLSPRKPKSPWSKLNKERVERLIADGRMRPEGLAKIERAKADGSWSVYDRAEALETPEDLALALNADAAADANFRAFSPSSRKGILWWLDSAKRPETRARRIAETVHLAARNIKAAHPKVERFETPLKR